MTARGDCVALLARLTDGFVRSIPAGGSPAAAALPGAPPDDRIPSIEGFARMSVAWAAWLAHRENPADLAWQGRHHDVAAILARGLADGTDPRHGAWWGPITDRDQRIVEAAEVATALWLGGERLRDAMNRLDPDAFDRALDWIALVDGRDVWPDNWVLFPMISRLVRLANGRAVDVDAIDAAVDWMLRHDAGDGWSSDGAGHALDLYSGWAIHWHLLWWVAIDGRRRPAVRRRVIRRAQAWLRFIAAGIADDGSSPRFGRSLGYRFAVAAPFGQAALLGIDPLPPGVARRLTGSVIRRALADGAVDDATDWFRIGVGGERPAVVERYVSAGAVAWAAHAFVPLALPAAHPFWSARERPAASASTRDRAIAAARAGLLVTRRSGGTTLHNARSGHPPDIADHDYAATYGKLAYRSGHPFDVPIEPGATAGSDDALVAIEDDRTSGTIAIAHRNESTGGWAGPGWIRSTYHLPTSSPTTVRTAVLVLPGVEIWVSHVRASGPIRLRDGGPVLGGSTDARRLALPPAVADPAVAVGDGRHVVAIRGLLGFDRGGTTSSPSDGRSNLVHDRGVHPWVEEAVARAGSRTVASALVVAADEAVAMRRFAAVRFDSVDRPGRHSVRVIGGEPVVVGIVSLGNAPDGQIEIAGHRFAGRVRVGFAAEDGSAMGGERIAAIAGVVRLERPGTLALRRLHDGVEVTTATGIALDRDWAGPRLCWARFGDAAWGFGEPVRLTEPGVIPEAMVRRSIRSAGTTLVTMRLEE